MKKILFAATLLGPAAAWGQVLPSLRGPNIRALQSNSVAQASVIAANQAVADATAQAVNAQVSAISAANSARKAASAATTALGGAIPADLLGQPNGPAPLDNTGALSAVSLLSTRNLVIFGPSNRTNVPTDPAALPGMATVAIRGQMTPPLIAAPVTEIADPAARRLQGALVGDKFITVSSVANVQPGEEITVLDSATHHCYGGDNIITKTVFGIVGTIEPARNRIYIDTSNQIAVGAYAYGRSQGLLTDSTGTPTPPASEIGSTIAIPIGAQVSFNNYAEGGVTVSRCIYSNANATPGGEALAAGMSIGRVTDPYAHGVALGMSPSAILGPLANMSDDEAFAMNPTVTAYPGSSGNLKGIELDLINNSGRTQPLNFGYWTRSNGNTENGAAFMADGFGKAWFRAFYCHAADQACVFDDSSANTSTWDTGSHSAGAEYNGLYSVAAIGLPTARTSQITTLYSSLIGASGSTRITISVPSGTPVPVVGSAIGNHLACQTTNPYTCGSTFTAGTTITAISASGTTYTLTLSQPLDGGLGAHRNNVAIQSDVNSVEQFRWGHSAQGVGAYDPGIGAIGTVDWLLGPVADGVGATYQIGPYVAPVTIDAAGNVKAPAALTVMGVVKGAAAQATVTTVANLMACNVAAEGTRDGVTDSTMTGSGNFGATVAGGGSFHVPVYCDGTSWKIE